MPICRVDGRIRQRVVAEVTVHALVAVAGMAFAFSGEVRLFAVKIVVVHHLGCECPKFGMQGDVVQAWPSVGKLRRTAARVAAGLPALGLGETRIVTVLDPPGKGAAEIVARALQLFRREKVFDDHEPVVPVVIDVGPVKPPQLKDLYQRCSRNQSRAMAALVAFFVWGKWVGGETRALAPNGNLFLQR